LKEAKEKIKGLEKYVKTVRNILAENDSSDIFFKQHQQFLLAALL